MKTFTEWQMTEFANNIEDLQVRQMLETRLNQLFDELEKTGMNKLKAINMLAIIIGEFQQKYNIKSNGLRQAIKMAGSTSPANPPMDELN